MGASLKNFSPRGRRIGVAVISAIVLATGSPFGAHAEEACLGVTEAVRTANVTDARSIALEDGRVLRVAGIETFALLSDDFEAAETAMRDRLEALVSTSELHIHVLATGPDRYGRLPALISAAGEIVQEVLAREGLGIAFATDESPLPCFARLLAAEDEARREGRGFWSGEWPLQAVPAALRPRIGRFAIFEGEILSVGNRRATTYLNFGTWWSEDVTVEVRAADRDRFGGEDGLSALAGKRVRVRGFLEDKAGPMLLMRSPMQLEERGPPALANGEVP